ncbi:MAG: hypothetical protein KAI66_22250 [Lentisphaeria bacterium]|nr:hypothetical protein [Lentisphaeria bacterium]
MTIESDTKILRELAKRCMAAAATRDREKIKGQWRRLHDCDMERPMIYIWAILFTDELEEIINLECTHPLFRQKEQELKIDLYHHYLGDDYLIQPYLVLQATRTGLEKGAWGVSFPRRTFEGRRPVDGGAADFYVDPPLKSLDDLSAILPVEHGIDEDKTAGNRKLLEDAVGDIIPIHVDRTPIYFRESLAPTVTNMRGMTQIMMDMADDPDGLHRLLGIMQKAVLAAHEKGERLGDISRADQFPQSCPYSNYTVDPAPNVTAKHSDLWCLMHAQEFTGISPRMHKGFALDYQKPIMEMFAASAYGCCEDLTHKIDMLREVKNLRQISVTPASDLEKCAEQIGGDYIISWRPNPTDQVCATFDRDRVRRIIAEGRDVLEKHGCHYEINLKDVVSVQGDRERMREWVKIVRSVIE